MIIYKKMVKESYNIYKKVQYLYSPIFMDKRTK